ncbi:MAG TPA: penicillin acylase family protein [Syntrophales bacterium]|nr:penicillin acylase family protein [Syntrophales bacterium]
MGRYILDSEGRSVIKLFKGIIWLVCIVVVIGGIAVGIIVNPFGPSPLNRFTRDGNLTITGLTAPVTVLRDEKGMAYIYAQNMDDLTMAQGFVAAQDRLFQMELTKLFASGRISEFVGEKARDLDIRMRTLGFRRNAVKHAGLLSEETRNYLQNYVDGVNAFINTRTGSIHLEFKLAGLRPSEWTIEDSLTILYYMGWNSAGNAGCEMVAQMLIEKLGPARAAEIFPITVNPDDVARRKFDSTDLSLEIASSNIGMDKTVLSYVRDGSLKIGSNNWATGAQLSTGGKPVVANDPHLNTTMLPSPWYPCGLITPATRSVGVTVPGMGGMVVGRTDHFAIGVTNAYSDTQDLYVETVDPANPDNYLEGDRSVPFEVIKERLKIKDRAAPGGFSEEEIQIRLTKRGPVISGVMSGLKTDKVITVRWSSFEAMGPVIGFEQLQKAETVTEIRRALKDVNQVALNFVFADDQGNFGWQTTGRVPIRTQRRGLIPYTVHDDQDNWTGWIPWEDMPHAVNPDRGWVGTCNHMTVGKDYPWYYTSWASPSYRYRRLVELMDKPGEKSVDDHWQYQRDTANLMAETIAPVMGRVLIGHDDTRELGRILTDWNYADIPESAAPTVFQSVYGEFALLVYGDELGDELAREMLDNWYFWEERLEQMVIDGDSPWFDNVNTAERRERRDDLFHEAALNVLERLRPVLGDNPDGWLWGKVHQHEFLSPIRRSGIGKGLLGGGSHPAAGSGETLYRGIYDFNKPFHVTVSASLRMVADLDDPDKILAVLPGGIAGRQFDPHSTDQIRPFMDGEKRYWWFSDRAIKEHTKNTLTLHPKK